MAAKKKTSTNHVGMRQQSLSPLDIKERGADLAKTQRELERAQDAHRLASSKLRMQVKTFKDRISQLSEEVDTGLAWVSVQSEMFEGVTANGKDPVRKKGKRGTLKDATVPTLTKRAKRAGNVIPIVEGAEG